MPLCLLFTAGRIVYYPIAVERWPSIPLKVLFYSINTLMSTPNYGAQLELMHDHLEAGDEIFLVRCKGELASCHVNNQHWKSKCWMCKSKFDSGIRHIDIPADHVLPLKTDWDYSVLPQEFPDLESLNAFTLDGSDIGMAVAASVIEDCKNYNLDTVLLRDRIRTKLEMAYLVHRNFQNYLNTIKPDRVYLFNGRLAETRPVLRVCQAKGVDAYVLERGWNNGRYMLTVNCLCHEMDYIKRHIDEMWAQGDPDTRLQHSTRWLEDRRKGVDQGFHSFVKQQQSGLLPKDFDPAKKNIGIFISSEYEFATMPEWKLPFYRDQLEGVARLARDFQDQDQVQFWVRMHPNLKQEDSEQLKGFQALARENYRNLHIIWPKEQVSTYALVDHCDAVMTFGSTVGLEATFWGRPSILAGRSAYEDLDVCYIPKSHAELIALIQTDLIPKPKDGAIKYGYRQAATGIPFRKFQMENVTEGTFLGHEIKPQLGNLKNKVHYKVLRRIDKIATAIKGNQA